MYSSVEIQQALAMHHQQTLIDDARLHRLVAEIPRRGEDGHAAQPTAAAHRAGRWRRRLVGRAATAPSS